MGKIQDKILNLGTNLIDKLQDNEELGMVVYISILNT